jgi:hypothetical protein
VTALALSEIGLHNVPKNSQFDGNHSIGVFFNHTSSLVGSHNGVLGAFWGDAESMVVVDGAINFGWIRTHTLNLCYFSMTYYRK